MIKIRDATKEDVEQIISLLLQVSELHYINRPNVFKRKSQNDMKEYALDILKSEEQKMFVATDETLKIYGILIYKVKKVKYHANLKPSRVLWIEELCVDEKCRKKGIGKMLILEAENMAKELKCRRIELNCWEFNESAMKFYKEIGMKTQRRVMEKKIGGDKNEIF